MEATVSTFKSFKGGKSKAMKGLARFNEALLPRSELLLSKGEDGEWGFDVEHATDMLARMGESKSASQIAAELGAPQATVDMLQKAEAGDNTASSDDGAASESDTSEALAPVAAPNMFAVLGQVLSTVAAHPAATNASNRAASRSSYTIEKDRPEQNGIKRPSAGGLCRAVWDEMDHLREKHGEVPNTKLVREAAEAKNWNVNNAMIEFYQWRKFNGITGRAKKVEAAVAAIETGDIGGADTANNEVNA